MDYLISSVSSGSIETGQATSPFCHWRHLSMIPWTSPLGSEPISFRREPVGQVGEGNMGGEQQERWEACSFQPWSSSSIPQRVILHSGLFLQPQINFSPD